MHDLLIATFGAGAVMSLCSEQFNSLLSRLCERLSIHFTAWQAALGQFKRTYREVTQEEKARRFYV